MATKKKLVTTVAAWDSSIDAIFGMANLVPKNTGLKADIWSPHKGGGEKLPHSYTRVKITYGDAKVSVTVEPKPKIKAQTPNIKHSEMKAIKEAMEYVGRNYDLFLKHLNDVDDEFTDLDLMRALSDRGDFKM